MWMIFNLVLWVVVALVQYLNIRSAGSSSDYTLCQQKFTSIKL